MSRQQTERSWVRYSLIALGLGWFTLILVIPVIVIFLSAFSKGLDTYLSALSDSDALSALWLTLTVSLLSVPLNIVFGVCAAWAIARFKFRGREALLTLIDLPFSVSPVVAGLMFVMLFGSNGWFGEWLEAFDIKIIFSTPGIVLATTFITVPFVAREVLPLLQSQGVEEEEASIMLGASGWTTFWRVTLPSIRLSLLYGVLLCTARAVGEFGAVSVVSGHIRGQTNTMPLHIEILYNEYQFAAAFAVASLLASFGLITLLAETLIDKMRERQKNHILSQGVES
ncbi:sulfate ABC transporter permease subunit CysW [Plesiomonas sp.]|uniref:sulfate ABC transporter permease subunit CysW n=1 Tax=Plesiomonas sp. TaxID=2486279 RepID=UPI003F3EB925